MHECNILVNANNLFITDHPTDDKGRLKDYLIQDEIDNNTKLYIRPKIRFKLETDSDQIILYFYNKRIKFPSNLESALIYIVKTREFTPKEVSSEISENSKIILCKRLIKEGFLTVKNTSESLII